MTSANPSLIPWQSKLRLAMIVLAAVVLILELLFALFRIVDRPLTPFDFNAVVAGVVLIATRPGIFTRGFKQEFRLMPVLYKAFLAVAAYLLLVKVAYFLGFLAGTLFKH